jgi:hypothetical protein
LNQKDSVSKILSKNSLPKNPTGESVFFAAWDIALYIVRFFFFFFFLCLSLLIYILKFQLIELGLIQSTGFFKSKTVDYSRHKGLDQRAAQPSARGHFFARQGISECPQGLFKKLAR